jgi:citrate lyase gamma subunit
LRARVEIEIDRLVLHGFGGSSTTRRDGEAIRNAIQEELQKIIVREKAIKVSKHNNLTRKILQIHIASLNPYNEMDLKDVGTQIAHTIYSSWSINK